jgi:hypothetical protein
MLLEFRDNGRAHDDLVLALPGYTRTADSYYLALDSKLRPGDESPDKRRAVLVSLLQSWLTALDQLSSGDSVCLPYDFSDEYIGVLVCTPTGEQIQIMPGFLSSSGWSVSPSDPKECFPFDGNYSRDLPNPVMLQTREFRRQVYESISLVRGVDGTA